MRNHLGSYECKLCLTLHNNEVSHCIIASYIRMYINYPIEFIQALCITASGFYACLRKVYQ